jgi:hypothetical protein
MHFNCNFLWQKKQGNYKPVSHACAQIRVLKPRISLLLPAYTKKNSLSISWIYKILVMITGT